MRWTVLIALSLFSVCSRGQSILIPGKGIQGDSIQVNISNIQDVLRRYGNEYEKIENSWVRIYKYKNLGLWFYTKAFDKNQIVRRIFFESPFQGRTENGVILGKTTCKQLDELYPNEGWFAFDGRFEKSVSGVTYYLYRKGDSRKCDKNEIIFRVEINTDGPDGVSNDINYVYDTLKEMENLNTMLDFFRGNPLLSAIDNTEFRTGKYSFNPKSEYFERRETDFGIVQYETEIRVGQSAYHLNSLSKNDTLFYAQLKKKDSVCFNYRNLSKLGDFIAKHNEFYQSQIDTLNENCFVAGKFVYGHGCGFVGFPPEKCREMTDLIAKQNYKVLAEWLRSPNPEIQAYGLEGMYKLAESKVNLTSKDVEIMEYVVGKKTKLYACSGCVVGIDMTYADIVRPKDIAKLKKRQVK